MKQLRDGSDLIGLLCGRHLPPGLGVGARPGAHQMDCALAMSPIMGTAHDLAVDATASP